MLIQHHIGYQNGSPGTSSKWFWTGKRRLDFRARFWSFFSEKMKKHKKRKSSFRIVKYSVSWGSPCWKKQATMRKNASFFSLIFHRFFEKIRRKIVQKAWKPALCTKIDEKARSERRFLAARSEREWHSAPIFTVFGSVSFFRPQFGSQFKDPKGTEIDQSFDVFQWMILIQIWYW